MLLKVVVFLALNFGALAIGGFFTGIGVSSEWYTQLNKAPWTPPGWVFGFAWSTIMVLFSVYMAILWTNVENKRMIMGLFVLQWVLNVAWNPVFFYLHKVTAGLIIVLALTVLVGYFLVSFWPALKLKSLLILPYLIWLMIATSLNGYILFKN